MGWEHFGKYTYYRVLSEDLTNDLPFSYCAIIFQLYISIAMIRMQNIFVFMVEFYHIFLVSEYWKYCLLRVSDHLDVNEEALLLKKWRPLLKAVRKLYVLVLF